MKFTHLFLLVALLIFGLTTAGDAFALTVKDIRFGQHPGKTRMVLDLDQEVPYRVFTLSDSWRLVIDLPAFTWDMNTLEKPAYTGITDIRQGAINPQTSRIVLDINKSFKVSSAFFLPAEGKNGNRLVIDFSPASIAEAMAGKGKVFGKLEAEPGIAVAKTEPPPRLTAPPPQAQQAVKPEPVTETIVAAGIPGMILPPHKPEREVWEKPLIVIDAGHGGVDPGAVAHGFLEKNITLAMAKKLKKQLEETGRYNVKLTRESDVFLRLYQRVGLAREAGGDLFVSLHADSIGKSNVRGASIYTLDEKASDEQTARLAMQENRADLIAGVDLSHEDQIVAGILVDLAMRDTMNQSKFFANTVVESFKASRIKTLENPHRYAGFAVLKAPDMPSILVEMGFISNASEARLLSSAEFQSQLSRALISSFDAYFEKVRRNQRI